MKENDIGCQAGHLSNAVLPWARGEDLPALGEQRNVTLAPYMRTQLRRCAIVVDRHVHKNGGSTVRDLLLEHERMGHALYQGYTQMYWNRDYRVLRRAAEEAARRGSAPEHVLLIEAHFGWVEMSNQVRHNDSAHDVQPARVVSQHAYVLVPPSSPQRCACVPCGGV